MEPILNEKVEEMKEDLLCSIVEMVKIPSVSGEPETDAPFGKNVGRALDKALEIAEGLGFETVNLDGYAGYAQYGKGDDYIGIVGHLDVVEEGVGWKYPPFGGVIDNGRIYGRGVLDNKGPIMSALYALYAVKESGLKLSKPVRIIFGTNEETGFHDIPFYLSKEKPPIMGFTPDCKYPVVYGERGRANIRFSAEYGGGNFALRTEVFFDFLNKYILSANNTGDRLGIDYSDKEFGKMEMKNYQIGIDESELYFTMSLSYPSVVTIDEILDNINGKLPGNMNVELLLNWNPVKFEKDNFMVRAMQKAYEEVTGMDGTPVTTTGGTYAKVMPNIVPFGPSFPGQKGIAHNPDEWMDINDIVLNAKIYAQAIYNLAQ